MYQNNHQVRFEILGNLPIKNNYIVIYDFTVVSYSSRKHLTFRFYGKYKNHGETKKSLTTCFKVIISLGIFEVGESLCNATKFKFTYLCNNLWNDLRREVMYFLTLLGLHSLNSYHPYNLRYPFERSFMIVWINLYFLLFYNWSFVKLINQIV